MERLLQELTYLSSFEQDTSVLAKAQINLLCGKQNLTITSSIEELLFHRLGKEWETRSGLSALLEQIQLSQTLGKKRLGYFLRNHS